MDDVEPVAQPLTDAPRNDGSAEASAFAPPRLADATASDSVRSAQTLQTARPGDLTMPWRVMVGLSWLVAFFAYAAIYQASVQIGIGTWWIGPRAQQTIVFIRVLPFLLSLGVTLLAIYNVPRVVNASIVGSLAAALIAVPDLSRSTGLAAAEFAVAALLLVISIAALSGRYRPGRQLAAPSPASNVPS